MSVHSLQILFGLNEMRFLIYVNNSNSKKKTKILSIHYFHYAYHKKIFKVFKEYERKIEPIDLYVT